MTRYLAHGAGFILALAADALFLAPSTSHAAGDPMPTSAGAFVRMGFVGANPTPQITSSDPLAGVVNYFIGNDPTQWRTNVPTAAEVRYRDLYPGIDLAVYGRQGGEWEYDVVVAPGADASQFDLAISGSDAVHIEQDALVIGTGSEAIRQRAPVLYQEVGGVRRPVTGGYTIRADGSVGFRVGEYDRSLPLVIDPITELYGTYLGGSADEYGQGIAVDSAGNTYITGQTGSTNFPTQNAIQPTSGGGADAFLTKINAAGTAVVYSTYLGGTSNDGAFSIAVDSGGNAYITGSTASADFPTKNPIQPSNAGGLNDAFLTKINGAGDALVYSTYLGGSGDDVGVGIAVDSGGSAYVVGDTGSTDLPTVNPIQPSNAGGFADLFALKINATGNALVYSTYLGGSGNDNSSGIAVDTAGNAYVTGFTQSTNFPTVNPLQAGGSGKYAVVTKINAAGTALVYSSYLGGGSDEGNAIAVDSGGNVYITGDTGSALFPTVNAIQSSKGGGLDAFVAKVNAAGTALVYSTYLGGSGQDKGRGIAVDGAGNTYVTGETYSANFPIINAVQPNFHSNSDDAFVTDINAAGTALVYSTYLGGTSADSGSRIAVDAGGNAYIVGITYSTDFPTVNPIQPHIGSGGYFDAFVAKVGPAPPTTPTGLHITGATASAVYFGWANPDPSANLTVSDGTTATPLAPGTTAFARTDVPAGGYVCLSVAAWNSAGASAWSDWVCGLVVPQMPSGLHISGATTSGVSFAWTDPDPFSAIALGVGTTGGTTYTGLVLGTTSATKAVAAGFWACAQVAAYNSSYASAFTPWTCGLAVPNAPTAIHVTGHTASSVTFGWTDSDPYSGIAVSNGSTVSTIAAGGTAYVLNGMATNSWVCISLAAYNASGASPWTAASTGWVCGQAT